MRTPRLLAIAVVAVVAAAALSAGAGRAAAQARPSSSPPDSLRLSGLGSPVEVLRDSAGIHHIYARNEHDLVFAQGYLAARERMFQLEMWRRQATGTVAELLGPREVERDRGARLFRFRGDMARELAHYHPNGAAIVRAFVEGVNARVAEVRADSALLPLELRLLGALPGPWTPEVVISRHQGLVGNVDQELQYGRAVAAAGERALLDVAAFGPGTPDVRLDPAVNGALLREHDVLARYRAFRAPLRFQRGDLMGLVDVSRATADSASRALEEELAAERRWRERHDIGSNNWVVSGRRTRGGRAIMANDPHRALGAPALRHWVHLVAPGWNVIGGGEPALPGVSIGHNEHGAWGLTIFGTDGEDLYVYQTDPTNPRRYRYSGGWETMRAEVDTIRVKGAAPVVVEHRFTRHGPVVFEDSARHVAYAVRAAWLEPGSAPYLASLRMDQARTWKEFRDACRWSDLPGENMVWADTSGTIGWQAVGRAPVRRDWSGLVPVPGDGRYEWDGILPNLEKPHAVNPPSGYLATANNDLIPERYPHRGAVGWSWADPYRWRRITEVLDTTRAATVQTMAALQTDYASLPARELVPLLAGVRGRSAAADAARRTILAWDRDLDPDSRGAALYAAWQRHLQRAAEHRLVPPALRAHVRGAPVSRLVGWMTQPPARLGAPARDSLLVLALDSAAAELARRFGPDTLAWRYGDVRFRHARLTHPMSAALPDSLRALVEVGPLPRGGDGNTVGAAGGAENQVSGASFRLVVEVGNWDAALGTQTPGQSGDPRSAHYRDLFAGWARNEFFRVPYSRPAVERAAEGRVVLVPGG
ncbi:MAG TPA: penicillin acylase family protein [Gemmatimonadaceae bacterium]|nr:penicillin acylase family protein [Gemmatimonadaceae bacterium]